MNTLKIDSKTICTVMSNDQHKLCNILNLSHKLGAFEIYK